MKFAAKKMGTLVKIILVISYVCFQNLSAQTQGYKKNAGIILAFALELAF